MSAPGAFVVEAVGLGATIQDGGRFGLLRYGVTPAGPMDPDAFAIANRLMGNEPGAAVLEIAPGGLTLLSETGLCVAFAGGAFRWRHEGRSLPSAARIRLRPGERLRAGAGPRGVWTYLAVPGGIDVPRVMGSRATHIRARLGGLDGRMLSAGDRLRCGASTRDLDDAEIAMPALIGSDAPLRVVLGPQDDHVTPDALALFLSTSWRVAASADRMAYALEGAALAHTRGHDIVSDGVALGAVQVSGAGRPTVLMADRQPTGGYPKIAHVVRADIGRLAQMRPGESCRFVAVDVGAARAALLARAAEIAALRPRPLRSPPTGARLSVVNLIDGVVDARD